MKTFPSPFVVFALIVFAAPAFSQERQPQRKVVRQPDNLRLASLLGTNLAGQPKDDAYRPATAVEQIPGYELVWHDEFDNDGPPDPKKWNFEQGFQRNNELQWYQPQNAVCKGGLLVIEGRKEQVANPAYDPKSTDWRKSRQHAEYTSASLNTWGKNAWTLSTSVIVVRARLTPQPGYFPAIWTTGPGTWPYGGEVDLMENYGERILANFAWGSEKKNEPKWHAFTNPKHGDKNKPKLTYFTGRDRKWLAKFHVWKLVGSTEKTQIFLDGELLNEVSHETAKNPRTELSKVVYPFKEKHALILNLAIGGPGGDPSNAKLPFIYEVDYARVYRSGKAGGKGANGSVPIPGFADAVFDGTYNLKSPDSPLERYRKLKFPAKDENFGKGWQERVALEYEIINGDDLKSLRRGLKDQDPFVRAMAGRALGILGDKDSADALAEMVESDPEYLVRLRAVESLGYLKLKPEAIERAKKDRSGGVRWVARFAADQLKSDMDCAKQLREGYAMGLKRDVIGSARVGQAAPDFAAQTSDGKPFKLSTVLGKKPIAIYFAAFDG